MARPLLAVEPASQEPEPEFEATAEVEAPATEPTSHVLDEQQLSRVPGTRGDPIRAVEVLPGVGRTAFGTNPGAPPLRGSAPNESAVFFDGVPAPVLYHFGGLTSVVNPQLLESVTLYPGNFSARYGRLAGGVIEARVREPRSDRAHFMLDLSLLDDSALAEGPLGESTSVAVAARRSNLDFFFAALLDDATTRVVAAPVYWDYQAVVAHRFSAHQRLRAMLYGSSDRFELLASQAREDPAIHGKLSQREVFHHLQLSLESQWSAALTQRLVLSAAVDPAQGSFGNVDFDYTSKPLAARAEWSLHALPWLRVDAGLDAQLVFVRFRYHGPSPAPAEGTPPQGTLAGDHPTSIASSFSSARPGAYVQSLLQPTHSLSMIAGVRVDYDTDTRRTRADPRFTSRLELTPTTLLKLGVGAYSQPPEYWETMKGFGNPRLRPYRTLQSSLGIEQRLGRRLRATLEGFHKYWQDRVVGTPGGAPPIYRNGGTGRAYGAELSCDWHSSERSRVLLSYTLSRSERRDGAGQPTRLFDRDQTHQLSLSASLDLGRGWQAGARFRYVTGNPYSAVRGAVYDASTDTYRPLYDELYTQRYPAFHQLDLRVEKLWHAGPVALTAYLEIMNVYNARNTEQLRYSFDYDRSQPVRGLPFFPNLGVRGEL